MGSGGSTVPFLRRRFSVCPQSKLDCPECEVHTENPMMEFLVDLRQILEAINADGG